ncbi:MAG TPA: chloride channel protein [Prolixibacteraceae bacterium]|nr:chloride channel protein [Prolixibacteraceae bacterium]
MKKFRIIIDAFYNWRLRNISTKTFIIILSIIIGILSGFIVVIIKNAVKLAYGLLNVFTIDSLHNYLLFIYPIIGIALTVLFIKYILRKPVRPGIPNVLYSISKRKGFISFHNTFSSVITSALTVGFGGSVGLEGPTVSTGSAIASQLARFFRLEHKYVLLMLACACAGSMAAIFKAPIAAIVFAVEVIMIDLTTFSLIPLLLASASAVVTSYLFLGMDVLYPFEVKTAFVVNELPFYIALGIVAGLVSVYFTLMHNYLAQYFARFKTRLARLAVGGTMLGLLLILFPSLYGEGYEAINSGLSGNLEYLFDRSFFGQFSENIWGIMVLLLCVVLFKVVATSATFGAGGVGGIFAPTLFIGVNTGLLFATLVNKLFGFNINVSNFALVAMAGLIAGVLHAPLTGIFLIADISGGYVLFVPLMITAAFSYLTTKIFTENSVFTIQLAQRKQLVTHHKDKHALLLMNVPELIESDFTILKPTDKLRDLVEAITVSHRDLYPVVDSEGIMVGMLKLDDVRHLIFKQIDYDRIPINELMYMPEHWISPNDSMDEVVDKFEDSGRFNLAVINNGKYMGFISRASVYTNYRNYIKDFSSD